MLDCAGQVALSLGGEPNCEPATHQQRTIHWLGLLIMTRFEG